MVFVVSVILLAPSVASVLTASFMVDSFGASGPGVGEHAVEEVFEATHSWLEALTLAITTCLRESAVKDELLYF